MLRNLQNKEIKNKFHHLTNNKSIFLTYKPFCVWFTEEGFFSHQLDMYHESILWYRLIFFVVCINITRRTKILEAARIFKTRLSIFVPKADENESLMVSFLLIYATKYIGFSHLVFEQAYCTTLLKLWQSIFETYIIVGYLPKA